MACLLDESKTIGIAGGVGTASTRAALAEHAGHVGDQAEVHLCGEQVLAVPPGVPWHVNAVLRVLLVWQIPTRVLILKTAKSGNGGLVTPGGGIRRQRQQQQQQYQSGMA